MNYIKNILDSNSYQLPENVSTSYFTGDIWRLVLVERGHATYHFAKSSKTIKAGSLYLLSPNKRKISTSDEEFRISIIFFEPDRFHSKSDIIEFVSREQTYRLLRELFYELHTHSNDDFHLSLINSFMHIFLRI